MRYATRSVDLTDSAGNAWRLTVSTEGALVVTARASKAVVEFTPASTGTDAFDYSGEAATTFTLNDGTGATTVALTTDCVNLAGVVTAVDAALGAGYVVSADAAKVKIEAAAAGAKTFTVGGANAAAITGSAGYVNTPGSSGR
jgi:hypothetical protein